MHAEDSHDALERARVDLELLYDGGAIAGWRRSLDARISGLPADLPAVGTGLAAGGALAVGLGNAAIGDPLSGLVALLGGAVGGGAGYPLLLLRSAQRWHTALLDEHDGPEKAERFAVLVEAVGLAAGLADRPATDPEAVLTLDAARRLAWVALDDSDAAEHANTLRDLDDATRALRDRLATHAQTDLCEHALAAPAETT